LWGLSFILNHGLLRPHNRILWERLQQKHTLCGPGRDESDATLFALDEADASAARRQQHAPWLPLRRGTVLAIFVPLLRPAGLAILGMVALHLVLWIVGARRLKSLKASRVGEDIGTFARAFDRRAPGFDPLLVRAAWDVLQSLYGSAAPVPLRPTDRLADLWIDEEDLYDSLPLIAERTGRPVDEFANAQSVRELKTIGDFVSLLSQQTRVAA
jgi:hypothetical protein